MPFSFSVTGIANRKMRASGVSDSIHQIVASCGEGLSVASVFVTCPSMDSVSSAVALEYDLMVPGIEALRKSVYKIKSESVISERCVAGIEDQSDKRPSRFEMVNVSIRTHSSSLK